jgi:hypothetical protein
MNMSVYRGPLTSPARSAEAVTKDDAGDLGTEVRALFIGTGGNLQVLLVDDTTPVLLKNLTSGAVLPLRVKRVYATNTTATDIVALR